MYIYKAKVLKVLDGDSADVLIDLGCNVHIKERIRFYGIDAPETRTRNKIEKEKGLMVKQYVKNAIEGKTIKIKTNEKGKFGRYLATIWYDEKEQSLNDELVEKKMAKAYFGGKR